MAQGEDKHTEQRSSQKVLRNWLIHTLCYHVNVSDSLQEHLQQTILLLVSTCRLQVPRVIWICFLYSSIIFTLDSF